MLYLQIHTGDLAAPIQSLERYFRDGGVSIIQAAFAHSYFVHPDQVRARTPYYPENARRPESILRAWTREKFATWLGDSRQICYDDNQRAQMAWERYTGSAIMRGSGYGVRHIWGEPWNPDAFTAGWNLCYMPFWAGMLTEAQHPYPELQQAIQQASWDLYFSANPVCPPPDFVADPGMDLAAILQGQPLLILAPATAANHPRPSRPATPANPPRPSRQATTAADGADGSNDAIIARVKAIRTESHQSWSNISKATLALQGKAHDPFGTPNVENSSKSCVRKICRETGLTLAQLESLLSQLRS